MLFCAIAVAVASLFLRFFFRPIFRFDIIYLVYAVRVAVLERGVSGSIGLS